MAIYTDPVTGQRREVDEMVRLARGQPWGLGLAALSTVCRRGLVFIRPRQLDSRQHQHRRFDHNGTGHYAYRKSHAAGTVG